MDPSVRLDNLSEREEQRILVTIYLEATSDEDAKRRLRKRLDQRVRERHHRERMLALEEGYGDDHRDDYSRAVGEEAAEFEADMVATFGTRTDGTAIRPSDLPPDDGQGYDRL